MSSQVTAPGGPLDTFDLYPLRFGFRALDRIHFPPGKSGNVLRGHFGKILKQRSEAAYSRFFAPISPAGQSPSGLHDPPRPFVIRASHLDGLTLAPGDPLLVGINLFEVREPDVISLFRDALADLVSEGLGPGRGRAELETMEGAELLRLPLAPGGQPVSRLSVRFLTPTQLKGSDRPDFAVLFARVRDRISTLRTLYGSGPLDTDFAAMGERAAFVRMTRCELEQVKLDRVSGRTGQRHSLGGFVGVAEYEGELAEFVPFLEIAHWTGVGRHTVWGKGEIVCERF